MEVFYVCNGFLLALNVYTAFFFLSTKMKTKPYREALGWLALMGSWLVFSDVVFAVRVGWDNLDEMSLYTAKDLVILPFYMLELSCLLEQEAERKTWKERWVLLLLSEIPFIMFILLVAILDDARWVNIVAVVYAYSFIVYNMVFIARKVRKYEKAYKMDPHYKGDNPFGWIKVVYILHVALFIVYSVVDKLGFDDHFFYYTIMFSIILMVNTYYVNKQLPLKIDLALETSAEGNVTEAESGVAKEDDEMDEDLKKRRKRVDMQLYMDQFLLKNPQYERRLLGSTPNKLTRRDIYLCMLIADGCNIETLSRNLSIGTKSVEVARSRLRAKLNLTPEQSLKKFLQDLM